jgi:hypothetical protein
MIALAEQGCAFRRGKDRLQIVLVEMAEHAFGGSLHRDAEHALGDCDRRRIRSRDMMKEGADRCEPSIARADAVVTLLLQVVEEGEHDIPVQILESKAAGRLALPFSSEDQKKSQRIPIGGHGVRAGLALSNQPLAEEGLEQVAERGTWLEPHGCSPWSARSQRSAANPSSSGVAVR